MHIQHPSFKYEPQILYSSDEKTRYQSSSGGVVATLVRYMFETHRIQTTVGYEFDKYNWFEPRLICSYADYQIVGSIYHELQLIKFLKDNLNNIKNNILITCLPCQVKPIRKILIDNKIDSFIVALTCSAQMSRGATRFLFKKIGIKENDIKFFRYRGNGWPSGVQIKTITNEYFFHNNKSIWTDIFNSHLFSLNRCFSCKDTFGLDADISVADPWIERYTTADNIGATTVLAHTSRGNELIKDAMQGGALSFKENLSCLEVIKSQEWTLKKKGLFCKYNKALSPFFRLIRSKYYINFLLKYNLIRMHTRLLNKILRVIAKTL